MGPTKNAGVEKLGADRSYLLPHFPPLRSAPDISTPVFSALAFLTISYFPLPHFQSPRFGDPLFTGHVILCMCSELYAVFHL